MKRDGWQNEPVKVGISACLMGDAVRYDGGHKHDRFLTDTLGQYVEYVKVCPEVECGLPVPRESMHLTGDAKSPRLVTVRTNIDHTERMVSWAKRRVKELENEGLCGFIFKSGSPSSGMERVKVYNEKGIPGNNGVGMFAGIFMEHFPLIPVEEEGRLHDPVLRENFIVRIFTLKHWREVIKESRSLGNIVSYHTKNKLLILSHSEVHYRKMGSLVAKGKGVPIKELYNEYETLLMDALKLKTTRSKNCNVLQHILGYFKKELTSDEKQELLDIILDYQNGFIPLIVPITLINHYVRKYGQPYLKEQTYLNPHPMNLKLRNHV
ncbi:MAG: DUF523 and DUF1722 domain-containing protein [Desulfatiglans sp.]|jgi:uncharacterized protein YbgA (DUF1722 family)/uncharacterized protein YbbK (DUF523 family)|nr:DUF523 and DUF1722 domain-containing protein [Desulfatiglans sp.]